jgi:hypothetical protein
MHQSFIIICAQFLCRAQSKLVIPASSLGDLPDGTYSLTVTAYSWLGTSTSTTYSFTKRGPGEVPSVSVAGGDRQSFLISSLMKIATVLAPKSVCKGKQVREDMLCLLRAAYFSKTR